MKRFKVLLIFLTLFFSSCTKESQKVNYIWTGQEGISHFVPVCIVWYKQLPWAEIAWKPYKCFSQADAEKMRTIILRLTRPEKREPNPAMQSKDKLSLIFYNGFPEKLTVREVYFQIKEETFIGPLGKSDNLAKILLEKQEIRSGFYYPYKDLGAGHYHDYFERVLKSQESLRKQVERLKAEKEAESRKKIEEPNQAEP
jgi:hypothetical protein